MADQAVGRDYAVSFLRGGATLVPVAYKSLTAPAVEQVERVAERLLPVRQVLGKSRPCLKRSRVTLGTDHRKNALPGVERAYLLDLGTFHLRVHRRTHPSVRAYG